MNTAELLQEGRLAEAIDAQIAAVKADPLDEEQRYLLFALFGFNGDWERAGRQLKMYYGTQVRSDPPTFLIYVNDPKLAHFSYRRYIENQLRDEYGFLGTPIRIVMKGKKGK